tara:strand:- start:8042 stop:8365 length:324 start_codon:yes stop_codon:yes gene_type:complete
VKTLLDQLKARRLNLGLKQHDMMLRVGMSRQQYQRLESRGNPRLDTLELVAKGLNSELMLIPREKVDAVCALLAGKSAKGFDGTGAGSEGEGGIADDPWKGLLEEDS